VSAGEGAGRRTLADIMDLHGNYERGHDPTPPCIGLFACDVAHTCKKWAKLAFYEDDTALIVDAGTSLKFSEVLAEALDPVIVDDWLDTPKKERIHPIAASALVDEGDGHYTRTVRDFCASKGAYRLFWPSKGRGGQQTMGMKDLVEYQKKRMHNGKPLTRYIYNDDAFKEELYDERISLNRAIREAKRRGLPPPAPQILIWRAPDPEICSEFTSERRWTEEDEAARKAKKRKPGVRRKVIKVGDWFADGPNDIPDAVKMCLVQWYKIRRMFVSGLDVEADDEVEPGESGKD